MRRGEVVYRLLSVYNLPSWNNVNQDEDEVD
jgi:hypothetical protein